MVRATKVRAPTGTDIDEVVARYSSAQSKSSNRDRAIADFEFFVRNYFPHHARYKTNSKLHDHLYKRLPELIAAPKAQFDVIAAPRGEAKTTLCAELFPLWCIARGDKHFVIVIGATIDGAIKSLNTIKGELEDNESLAADFPDMCGTGPVWQATEITLRNGAKVKAFGANKKMRGAKSRSNRPDLIVLDDIENDENVRSLEQRDKTDAWIDKAVLSLGGAGAKCDVLYIGTILHYDAVLARKLRNPLWSPSRFQAIKKWPDRIDLWDRWEEILRNDGKDEADIHYAKHTKEMQRGSEVSWPEVRPLHDLMMIRIRVGRQAFDSEFQNDPVNSADACFGTIQTFVDVPSNLAYVGAVDPSLGKAGKGRDPSAILVGGVDRATGILYVIEALIRRRLPDAQIEDVIRLQSEYQCVRWAIETVQFQEFFHAELVKRSAVRGIPVPAVGIKNITDKQLRIESLQPHVQNGLIRIHASLGALLDQMRHYPSADHDDGPDALEMLWQQSLTIRTQVGYRGVISRHGLSRTAIVGRSDDTDRSKRMSGKSVV